MKDKMRCASCGATFKPVKSSQTKCERCEKREREQRAAARHAGETAGRPASAAPPPVRISGPAAALLGSKAPAAVDGTQAPPPEPPAFGMAAWRDEQRREQERHERERRERERMEREQARERERAESGHSGVHERPLGARLAGKAPRAPNAARAPQPPRPPREPKGAAPRFDLTDELRVKIEARYLELAQPVEFDGIRTKIADELAVPKSLVKKAVAQLRERMKLPSWWELQAYTGPEVELERIRAAYTPLLPLPEVGVHKALAEKLDLDPRAVYQGIRRIRAEMRLPQYNAPALHEPAPVADGETAPDARG